MKRTSSWLILIVAFLACPMLCGVNDAADWPTYLHDNNRVGATDDVLPDVLELRWTRLSPAPPKKAWEGPRNTPIEGQVMKHRVAFDDAHQVAVVGKRVYYGSAVDHHLYCVDSQDGREVWTFATGGPIRLAPTVAGGRVYFGSDDGHVYCLSADQGKLVWKLRVGPREERLLARGSLISRWPVRTGVLVDGNVAYFGAGIFPHENVYLVAADAQTGKVIWKNDEISQRDAGRDDLSPQGYLLVNKKSLFVPSGRSLPAAFDRTTGKYEFKRSYSWRSTGGGVVGGSKSMLADGQLFSFGAHHMLALAADTGTAGHAYIPGRQMTIGGELAFIATGKEIVAVDRKEHTAASRKRQELFVKRRNLRGKPKELAELDRQMKEFAEAGIVWRAPFAGDSALIATGNRIVAGGIGAVAAWDRETGKQVWSAEIKGEARGLAAADGILFVSSTSGDILAFGEAPDEPRRYQAAAGESPYEQDEWSNRYAEAAQQILKRTDVRQGFCLVLGGGEGRLAYELAKRSELQVYAVESDLKQVHEAQRRLRKTGWYGRRITMIHSPADKAPLSNYFANLIVSDHLLRTGKLPVSGVEMGRFVKPCGGKVCLASPGKQSGQQLQKTLQETYLRDDATVAVDGDWAVMTRGQLAGAGSWSHQYGNVGNTSFTKDYRVKGALGVLWYGDPGPSQMINRHEAASAPLTTNGRFFVQGTDNVRAYDAYNGLYLWEYKNPGAIRTGVFNNNETSNMAATDDALFVVAKETCTQLDAATGKVVHEFKAPQLSKDVPHDWGFLAVNDGMLYGTSTVHSELAAALRRRGRTVGSNTDSIFASEIKSQKRLWTYEGKNIMHVTIALGDGHLYFVESSISQSEREDLLLQDKTELKKLTGEAAKKEAELKKIDVRRAVCLDARTGEKIWSQPIDVTNVSGVSAGGGNICLMYHEGHVVICGANANGHYWKQFLSGQFGKRRLLVLDSKDGSRLWAKDANYMNRPVVVDDYIIAEPWSFHVHSGKERTRIHPLTGVETKWQFSRPGHHCGIITATPNMMLFRSGFIGYYDFYTDSGTRHFAGQRLGCWVNAIPGNGLVVIPEASAGCVCLFSITSTVVLEPREDRNPAWGIYSAAGPATPVKRLAVNIGAPGDRRDSFGNLWLSFPRPNTRGRMEYMLDIKPKLATGGEFYARNANAIEIADADVPWVLASGGHGLNRFELPLLGKDDEPADYTVRLHFAELDSVQSGERVFDIKLQGQTVAENFDIVADAGRLNALVRKFAGIAVTDKLVVELVAKSKRLPILSAIDVERE